MAAAVTPGAMRLAWALMLASGFAGLGYQVVWTQQASLWLGHEAPAVLAVVTAFFGGLALGALALGARIARSAWPQRWYAGCELVIAAWSLVLVLGLQRFSEVLLLAIGMQPHPLWQWVVAFGGTLVLLLPATAAMGATLPAMAALLSNAQGRLGGSGPSPLPALYACNTLGATAGVLATAFWMVPTWGLTRTVLMCAGLNLLCAVLTLRLWPLAVQAEAPQTDRPMRAQQHPAWPLLMATGWLGIAYEVLVVRVLSQVTENTVYTFAMLLAVYLVGTAAGAAAYARWGQGAERPALQHRLLWAVALACALGGATLWAAEWVRNAVALALAGVAPGIGTGMVAALAGEASLAVLAFALPTVAMGALFSHLTSHLSGRDFGRALGANTLGAALAPMAVGAALLLGLGAATLLCALVVAYLLLAAWPRVLRPAPWAAAALATTTLVLAPPLSFIDVPEGGRIVSHHEGLMAEVSVVEDGEGVLRLRINNRQQEGSSSTRFFDSRQALLPALLHPNPERALFLGLGTGVTARAAAALPGLQVQAVELLPEVISAAQFFVAEGDSPPSSLKVIAADARRFVRGNTERFDLIVADNFHPARSGSAALYTVEHFDAVRQRLADGGLFCQWLPLHQMDLATLRSIVRSFLAVYPGGAAILASNSLETPVIGLVARAGQQPFALREVQARLAALTGRFDPAPFGLHDEWALLGSFVAGRAALRRWSADAPLNTDDHPVVATLAPRITYAPDSAPRDRLLALLADWSTLPAEVLGVALGDGATSADFAQTQRLADYWNARNQFLLAGRDIRPSADVRAMLAQVQAPLLAVLRTSADFRPAYEPLLLMATSLAASDRAAAEPLLRELARLRPVKVDVAAAIPQ